MKEPFLDIVAEIVSQMAEDDAASPRDESIIEGLISDGYDLMDIDDALSWFESLADSGEELYGIEFWPGFSGIRVQAHSEREAMSPAAYNYLMRLNNAGIVEDSFREALMDKIMDLDIEGFGLEQMKALLGLALYSKGKLNPDFTLGMLVDQGKQALPN
ncbi:MAG TPA: DUF494 family protein [Nitrospirota bacterium]